MNFLKLWLLLFGMIVVGCGPDFDNPLDPRNNPGSSETISLGWANYESGNIDQAIANFREVLAQNPQNVEARIGLGWSLLLQQDVQGAIREFQLALAIDADAVDAHVGIAGAFLATEKYQSAIDHAQATLVLQPNYTFVHNPLITSKNLHLVLAQGYYYIGEYAKALEEVIIIDPAVTIDLQQIESELLSVLEELTQRMDGR